MPTNLAPSLVPAHYQTSTRMCGAPIELRRESGEVTPAWFSCRYRHCYRCRRHYIRRAASAFDELTDEHPSDQWHLLTLTQPASPGLLRRDLARAIGTQRALWARARSQIRWWRGRSLRGMAGAADPLQPPRLRRGERAGEPHPDWSQTWSESDGWTPADDLDGVVWCREVTTGADHDRWHVHLHVLCTSREVGERLNAAWQLAGDELGVGPANQWLNTDLRQIDRGAAVAYMCGYLAGSSSDKARPEVEALPGREPQRAYITVMSGSQRHNACGALRPVGLTPDPSDDPPTHVRLPGHGDVPADAFFGGSSSIWTSLDWRSARPLSSSAPLTRRHWGASLPSIPLRRPWRHGGDWRGPRERLAWMLQHEPTPRPP